jgi:zinc protease
VSPHATETKTAVVSSIAALMAGRDSETEPRRKRTMPGGNRSRRNMLGIELLALLITATALALATGAASAARGGVQQRTLDNGLEVLVREDHSAPLVCSFIWYRVGLRNERPGEAGLSHFLEHVAFKGTERFTGREMNRLVTARGGYLNGFTSMDYTAYVETLPKDALDLALEIEAERMTRSLISAEDVESEKGVILSEFAGGENDPSFLLRRQVMAAQFPDQPYGRVVLGDKDELRALTRDQVVSYYRRHYAPNNATLVVVGDVLAEDVFAKAEEHFGSISPGEPAPQAPNPGRGPWGEIRVELEIPGRTSYVQAVYGVPAIQHPDHVVLEVFQNVVSGGRTSRLYTALVDTGLAAQAGGWDYENPQPTVFAFEIALRPGVEHRDVEGAFDAVLDELGREAVGERELTKAKNQTKAQFIYSSDGVTELAHRIGYYHIIDSYEYLETFPERVDAVTAEDIQRVARECFDRNNRTVGWLIATDEEAAGAPAGGAAPLDVHWQHHADLPSTPDGPELGARVPVPTGLGDVTPIHEARLENGMRLIVQENHAAPFVAIYGNLTAGPVFDPPDKAGLAAFCAEMLSRGTETRTWQQIREELEFVAAGLSFGTGVQVGTISGRCLTDDLKLLLGAASEQLMSPAFPEEEIEKVRSEIIAAQERRDEDTLRVAEKELLAQLYPQGHPLHYPRTGTRETVSAITRDDLEAFHGRYYRPENMILAIVGDVDVDDATRLVQDSFGRWESAGDPARPELPPVPAPSEPRTVRVPVPNKTQADIALGFPGLSRRDPGYYRADLMNYVLGRGFTSRMNMHIREDLGLAYYVWTYFASYWGAGPSGSGVGGAAADPGATTLRGRTQALEGLRRGNGGAPDGDILRDSQGTSARRLL